MIDCRFDVGDVVYVITRSSTAEPQVVFATIMSVVKELTGITYCVQTPSGEEIYFGEDELFVDKFAAHSAFKAEQAKYFREEREGLHRQIEYHQGVIKKLKLRIKELNRCLSEHPSQP